MLDLQNVANSDVFGAYRCQTCWTASTKCFVFGQVQLLVSLITLKVVVGFLEHGDCQHESEWCYVCDEQTNLQEWNELRQCNREEEQVKEELELIV